MREGGDASETKKRVVKIRRLPPMPDTSPKLGYTSVGTDVSDE